MASLPIARKTGWRPSLPTVLGVVGAVVVGCAGAVGYFQQQSRVITPPGLVGGNNTASAGSVGVASAPTEASRTPGSEAGRVVAQADPPPRKPAPPAAAGATAPLRWPLWEFQVRQPIPARDPPLTPMPWRLVGATSNGGRWQLIILRQGKTVPEFYSTGDALPGGYVVGTITEEDVTLIQGKRAILLSYIGI